MREKLKHFPGTVCQIGTYKIVENSNSIQIIDN